MPRVIHSENVEKLVARQGRLYDLKRQSQAEALRNGRGKVGEVGFGPYLLISRERGAGGYELAERVGERLGWLVFDRAIVDEISREAHVREQLVEMLDEHVRSQLEEIIRDVLMPRGLGADSYLFNLRRVVMTLGHHGEVVILGRGAEYILPSRFGLRVRLVAPLEARVQYLQKREGISNQAAQEEIRKVDRERKEFARRYYDRDVDDPLNYDLVINTGALNMDLERAAGIVMASLAEKLDVSAAEE